MNVLLILSLISFVIGFFEVTRPNSWALGLPMGAVFLGVYFVVKVFSGETAQFDEDQRIRDEKADRGATAAPTK